jgi:hypothetical protein
MATTFLIEDFLHLPPVSMSPVVHFELQISPTIFEKIQNGPTGIRVADPDPYPDPHGSALI